MMVIAYRLFRERQGKELPVFDNGHDNPSAGRKSKNYYSFSRSVSAMVASHLHQLT
ncbi:MAG: hypothetical protein RSG77_22930 [Hafnia sp.]